MLKVTAKNTCLGSDQQLRLFCQMPPNHRRSSVTNATMLAPVKGMSSRTICENIQTLLRFSGISARVVRRSARRSAISTSMSEDVMGRRDLNARNAISKPLEQQNSKDMLVAYMTMSELSHATSQGVDQDSTLRRTDKLTLNDVTAMRGITDASSATILANPPEICPHMWRTSIRTSGPLLVHCATIQRNKWVP